MFRQFQEQDPDWLLNDPRGPNLATNLGKCYPKEVESTAGCLQPGYQFQDLLTVSEGAELVGAGGLSAS